MTNDEIRLRAAMHNNSTVVSAQNEKTGERLEFYKLGHILFDMDTLKSAGPEWIEQPRYMSCKALMMYLCGSSLVLLAAIYFLGE